MTPSTVTATAQDIDWVRWQLNRLVDVRTCNGALTRYDAERYEQLGELESKILRELQPAS